MLRQWGCLAPIMAWLWMTSAHWLLTWHGSFFPPCCLQYFLRTNNIFIAGVSENIWIINPHVQTSQWIRMSRVSSLKINWEPFNIEHSQEMALKNAIRTQFIDFEVISWYITVKPCSFADCERIRPLFTFPSALCQEVSPKDSWLWLVPAMEMVPSLFKISESVTGSGTMVVRHCSPVLASWWVYQCFWVQWPPHLCRPLHIQVVWHILHATYKKHLNN